MTYLVPPVLVPEDRDHHPGPEAPRESGDAGCRAVPPGRRGEEQAEPGEAEDPRGWEHGAQGGGSTSSSDIGCFLVFNLLPFSPSSFIIMSYNNRQYEATHWNLLTHKIQWSGLAGDTQIPQLNILFYFNNLYCCWEASVF